MPTWLRELTVRDLVSWLALVLVAAVALAIASEETPRTTGTPEPQEDRVPTVGRDVVERTASVTFPAGGESSAYKSAFVSCRSGERVVGGGLDADDNVARGSRNLIVVRSRPGDATGAGVSSGSSASSWYIQARRKDTRVVTTVTVAVRCAS